MGQNAHFAYQIRQFLGSKIGNFDQKTGLLWAKMVYLGQQPTNLVKRCIKTTKKAEFLSKFSKILSYGSKTAHSGERSPGGKS